MRLPTCPLVQRTLPALARRWVGKAKLFSEDINVIKEPVLGTAPGSPVVLSLPWRCILLPMELRHTRTPVHGPPVRAHHGSAPAQPPPCSVLGGPTPYLQGDN